MRRSYLNLLKYYFIKNPKTPIQLIHFVTSKCNAKCKHCFFWSKLNSKDELSLEEIDKFCNALIKIKKEINKVENSKFDKVDNPLKNAPHTYIELASNEWKHKYSREEAAFPNEFVKNNKYWAPVARVDNVYGDRNLVCSCPSMDEYKEEAA